MFGIYGTRECRDRIEVQGFGVENEYGRMIEASTLVVNGEPLNVLSEKPF
ncbi:hypothetical protein Sta7437_0986 [Stanieria cyanosphaera PCC 7437]|uniref:Uncharacterized protein n=1 Tax=Stanieria cyanosphaera (strain ATCC 29371 / PCC 7437) TaxID=111780 RepID=K9XR94_STAC7|nr:hypothetical protein Sta7437_0986 [Stanieria cyanosphaera PCC 7437]